MVVVGGRDLENQEWPVVFQFLMGMESYRCLLCDRSLSCVLFLYIFFCVCVSFHDIEV